jgi:8-oxo-dGTP pyrophosphatase MutT (NUDIX family)
MVDSMSLASPGRFDPQTSVIRQSFESDPLLDDSVFLPDRLRARFNLNIPWLPEETDENRHIKASSIIEKKELDGLETRAAILIPIIFCKKEPMILLTERSQHLSSHSGQISFPGGKFSITDQYLITTAKRETTEEVGIPERDIEVLGTFPEYCTISGYRVTPVIALIHSQSAYKVNASEVKSILEVPMKYLLNPRNFVLRSWESDQGRRHFYSITFENYFIWGATAAILRNFYSFLVTEKRG